MGKEIRLATALSLCFAAAFSMSVHADADPLARHRWKDRLLVVIAPDARDPKLLEQRRILEAAGTGVKERDLVVAEAVDQGPEAAALRRKFGSPDAAFRVVLVGKDGGAKLASKQPISAERLFGEIDAMPMRRQEIRER